MSESSSRNVPVPLVAFASWLLPGAGYWLIGQKARALTVGLSVIGLFVLGLLIGGVRLIEVPGWGDHGQQLIVGQSGPNDERVEEKLPPAYRPVGWVMQVHPMDEIRNKPWYIAQILNGPIDLIASWGSVIASHTSAQGEPLGYRSHSRTNELGVLYTAVAGMLNLLAIIDAASRAGPSRDGEET
ncbi:MAG TPA: DUF6677 family protein [Tepidisphaeraceae bacterium]|jgi:hypothetical protein|nr:DUF6677 family protein [Tepidisphaeraceae bacterium]